MYKTLAEAKSFMEAFLPRLSSSLDCRVLIAPSFPLLVPMAEWSKDFPLEIGAQNIHDQEWGAFTGETSAKLIQSIGSTFVLIGHSERRHLFHEEGNFIRKKVQRALMEGLAPILCIGETLNQRESGETQSVLQKQILEGLEGLSEKELEKVMLAYEPVWAIGTGKTATPEMAETAHSFCRSLIRQIGGETIASRMPILYGGSVNASNVKELMLQNNIDGALVGGASLTPESFLQIIHYNQ